MKLKILVILTILSFLLALNMPADAEKPVEQYRKVQGTINLAGGETAPKGGLELTVYADNGSDIVKTDVTMQEGAAKVDYQLQVPVVTGGSYIVYYRLTKPTQYINEGYFSLRSNHGLLQSDHSTMQNRELAEAIGFDRKSVSSIDMTIFKKRTISGTISLPEDSNPAETDIRLELNAHTLFIIPVMGDDVILRGFEVLKSVTLPAGRTTVVYSIDVPLYTGIIAYRSDCIMYTVGYRIIDRQKEYAAAGYYTENGTAFGDPDKHYVQGGIRWANGSGINVFYEDADNVNLTLIRADDHSNSAEYSTMVGKDMQIQGRIDYENDVDYFIFTPKTSGIYGVVFKSGEKVPVVVEGVPDYFNTGSGALFYCDAGKPYVIRMGGVVAVCSYNYEVKNNWGNTVLGMVMLQNGETAPPGGMDVSIESAALKEYPIYLAESNMTLTRVRIPPGKNSSSFKFQAPSELLNSIDCVRYSLKENKNYIATGYFYGEGMRSMHWLCGRAFGFGGGEGTPDFSPEGYQPSIDWNCLNLTIYNNIKLSGNIYLSSYEDGGVHAEATIIGRGFKETISLHQGMWEYTHRRKWKSSLRFCIEMPRGKKQEDYTIYVKIMKDMGVGSYTYKGCQVGKLLTVCEGYASAKGLTKDASKALKYKADSDNDGIKINAGSSVKAGIKVEDAVWNTGKVSIMGQLAPSYSVGQKVLIVIEDLTNYGFDVIYDKDKKLYKVRRNAFKTVKPVTQDAEGNWEPDRVTPPGKVMTTDIKVYINGKRVGCLEMSGKIVIEVSKFWECGYNVDYNNDVIKVS